LGKYLIRRVALLFPRCSASRSSRRADAFLPGNIGDTMSGPELIRPPPEKRRERWSACSGIRRSDVRPVWALARRPRRGQRTNLGVHSRNVDPGPQLPRAELPDHAELEILAIDIRAIVAIPLGVLAAVQQRAGSSTTSFPEDLRLVDPLPSLNFGWPR